MASPRLEAFALYDRATGGLLEGQESLVSFLTYSDDAGNALSAPAIAEIGGGWYSFLPVFADPDRGIVYTIDTGFNANPAKLSRYIRPEDWNADYVQTVQQLIQDVKDFEQGKWEIVTSGPDTNCFIVYAQDGTTVLKKFLLQDASGVPTTTTPFKRIPV